MEIDRERGQWIKERRAFLGIGQDRLAELLACEVRTLRYYEQGRRLPEEIAAKIVGYLELPPDQHDTFRRWLRGLAVPPNWQPGPPNDPCFRQAEALARLNGIIQTSTQRLQEIERQTAKIGRKHRIALEMIVNAIKEELAHLQQQVNTAIRPDATEAARAIVGAIDDLEQRLQTIVQEKSAKPASSGTRSSRSIRGPHKRSALITMTIVGIFLVLFGSMALAVRPHESASVGVSPTPTDYLLLEEAQTPLADAPTEYLPSEAAQTPLADAPMESSGAKRAVQLQVNRSLLHATVLGATAVAGDFGAGMAPQAATAFQAEFEDNIATIEALRPTADALGIMLLQQPVQPTDAPEATLFAEADAAAAAATGRAQLTPVAP